MPLLGQLPEQHWLSCPHPEPFGRHVHAPLVQKPLQHWKPLTHGLPPPRQLPPPLHTPLLQVPLQQSAYD